MKFGWTWLNIALCRRVFRVVQLNACLSESLWYAWHSFELAQCDHSGQHHNCSTQQNNSQGGEVLAMSRASFWYGTKYRFQPFWQALYTLFRSLWQAPLPRSSPTQCIFFCTCVALHALINCKLSLGLLTTGYLPSNCCGKYNSTLTQVSSTAKMYNYYAATLEWLPP